jgi:hypothetical protein
MTIRLAYVTVLYVTGVRMMLGNWSTEVTFGMTSSSKEFRKLARSPKLELN